MALIPVFLVVAVMVAFIVVPVTLSWFKRRRG
jgi:hypothetical protein